MSLCWETDILLDIRLTCFESVEVGLDLMFQLLDPRMQKYSRVTMKMQMDETWIVAVDALYNTHISSLWNHVFLLLSHSSPFLPSLISFGAQLCFLLKWLVSFEAGTMSS